MAINYELNMDYLSENANQSVVCPLIINCILVGRTTESVTIPVYFTEKYNEIFRHCGIVCDESQIN